MNHEKNGYSIVSGHVRISVNDNMYAVWCGESLAYEKV